jgi:hypothetical protein
MLLLQAAAGEPAVLPQLQAGSGDHEEVHAAALLLLLWLLLLLGMLLLHG